jgi:hypothetical protein
MAGVLLTACAALLLTAWQLSVLAHEGTAALRLGRLLFQATMFDIVDFTTSYQLTAGLVLC